MLLGLSVRDEACGGVAAARPDKGCGCLCNVCGGGREGAYSSADLFQDVGTHRGNHLKLRTALMYCPLSEYLRRVLQLYACTSPHTSAIVRAI
mgnify:CR=1 FL=1